MAKSKDEMTAVEWEALWTWQPTEAEVKATTKAVERALRESSIAAYRSAHPELNPAASDATVLALMDIAAVGNPKKVTHG